ncbi:hypothetical protein DL98DRAFT_564903 [Cadophora sp. DSE1049]|nr:hypothetical protein DL98DRAFT_564903 [Cadophora sp. DSE1049]
MTSQLDRNLKSSPIPCYLFIFVKDNNTTKHHNTKEGQYEASMPITTIRRASEVFKMEDSDEEVFYECLTPPQTPSPTTTKTFHLPLSTLSIYCRQHNSANSSKKASIVPQDGVPRILRDSAANDYLLPQKNATTLSSVVESLSASHMTFSEATPPPTTPPSTPPSSYAQLSNPYDKYENGECIESSPPSDVPPLSPSSSVSTTRTISEPPTPGKDGSIRPRRFWTSPTSPPSSRTSTSNKLDIRTSTDTNLQHREVTSRQTPIRRNQSRASPKPATSTRLARSSNVSNFIALIAQTGPFIPEGFHITNWPEAHSVIETETFEAGNVSGYGTYPVQLTAQQLARQKCNIMRSKVRHYGVDDEIKVVKSSGSVSGESEISSERDKDLEKGSHIGALVWKEEDVDADTFTEVKLIGTCIWPTAEEKCA